MCIFIHSHLALLPNVVVQVWNRENSDERLKCGGGLWSVAEVLFESIEEDVKKKVLEYYYSTHYRD